MRGWFEALFGPAVTIVQVAVGLAVALIALALIGYIWQRAKNRRSLVSGRNKQPRLGVIDAAIVDDRRRLVLVRRDNFEHLIMIGGPTDIVIERNIGRERPQAQPAPVQRSVAERKGPGATPPLPGQKIEPSIVAPTVPPQQATGKAAGTIKPPVTPVGADGPKSDKAKTRAPASNGVTPPSPPQAGSRIEGAQGKEESEPGTSAAGLAAGAAALTAALGQSNGPTTRSPEDQISKSDPQNKSGPQKKAKTEDPVDTAEASPVSPQAPSPIEKMADSDAAEADESLIESPAAPPESTPSDSPDSSDSPDTSDFPERSEPQIQSVSPVHSESPVDPEPPVRSDADDSPNAVADEDTEDGRTEFGLRHAAEKPARPLKAKGEPTAEAEAVPEAQSSALQEKSADRSEPEPAVPAAPASSDEPSATKDAHSESPSEPQDEFIVSAPANDPSPLPARPSTDTEIALALDMALDQPDQIEIVKDSDLDRVVEPAVGDAGLQEERSEAADFSPAGTSGPDPEDDESLVVKPEFAAGAGAAESRKRIFAPPLSSTETANDTFGDSEASGKIAAEATKSESASETGIVMPAPAEGAHEKVIVKNNLPESDERTVKTLGDLASRLEAALVQQAIPEDGRESPPSEPSEPGLAASEQQPSMPQQGAPEPADDQPNEGGAQLEAFDADDSIVDITTRRKSNNESLEDEMARLLGELTGDSVR